MVLSEPPSCVGTPRSREMVPSKNPPLQRMRSVSKLNISLELKTPRLGIVWFLVSVPLVWKIKVENRTVTSSNPLLPLYG